MKSGTLEVSAPDIPMRKSDNRTHSALSFLNSLNHVTILTPKCTRNSAGGSHLWPWPAPVTNCGWVGTVVFVCVCVSVCACVWASADGVRAASPSAGFGFCIPRSCWPQTQTHLYALPAARRRCKMVQRKNLTLRCRICEHNKRRLALAHQGHFRTLLLFSAFKSPFTICPWKQYLIEGVFGILRMHVYIEPRR